MVLVTVLIMVPVMLRFWSVLPERRPVHLLEEPEDGAELGGGAVRAFSELVGVRRRRVAELQGDFFDQSVRDNLRWCVVQGRGHGEVAIERDVVLRGGPALGQSPAVDVAPTRCPRMCS